MIISFYDNNIHEAVSTEIGGNEALKYIYIDRKENLMVATNTRILVTIPIELDKTDVVPDNVKYLYLSKEMFLYAKKNRCPIIFKTDGIHIGDIIYQYLEIGEYVPYKYFMIERNLNRYIDVFQCKINIKDLLAVKKSKCNTSDIVEIKWLVEKEKINSSDAQSMHAYGMVYGDYDKELGIIYSGITRYNVLPCKKNDNLNSQQDEDESEGEEDGQ